MRLTEFNLQLQDTYTQHTHGYWFYEENLENGLQRDSTGAWYLVEGEIEPEPISGPLRTVNELNDATFAIYGTHLNFKKQYNTNEL